MAKQVMQFRYYGEDGSKKEKNYPALISQKELIEGTAFDDYYPIIQLGIQSLPGTHFYLNNSNTSIIIGATGIYELDIEGYTEITKMKFDKKTLELIDKNPNAYLIIDIITDKEEV